ncbi:MAG: hypothetical protein QUS11_06165 [Candidatus Fermentibacter sp.]|nr:hypothetical protein [Candidatus Fermentibacter sp.]
MLLSSHSPSDGTSVKKTVRSASVLTSVTQILRTAPEGVSAL